MKFFSKVKYDDRVIYHLYCYGLVGYYGIPTIIGYLMPNARYTYILNIYCLVWLAIKAYQPLLVI